MDTSSPTATTVPATVTGGAMREMRPPKVSVRLAPGPAAATLTRAAQARQRFEQRLGINDELMSQ